MHRGFNKNSNGIPRNEAGKLFIGGLSWDTDQDSLLNFFSQYGEVIDCVVMKNQQTGKSRGFGFVTFNDAQCVDTVLSAAPHTIDGRQVDAKPCNPKAANKGPKDGGGRIHGGGGGGGGGGDKDKKIFMGGLPNVDEDFLRNFFGKYGKVLDVNIMIDQQNKKSRGFGFLTFESEDAVDQVCAEHFININGKQVECKRAEPRDGRDNKQGGYGGRRGHGQDMMGPPHGMDGGWNQGGNWNQGPPPHGPPPPGPPMGNMGFPPQGPGGYQQQQPPPGQGFPPQQGPPPQPSYQGYQSPPGYQQGGWGGQPPNASPGQQDTQQSYAGYASPQAGYSQPPTTAYSQWGATASSPVAPQPAAAQPPTQQPAQPSYSPYGQPPAAAAAPATPGYTPAPGTQSYSSHYNVAVADPSQPATPTTAQAGYSTYNPYGAPQTPASAVPDPYAPTSQPATAPGAQVPMGVPDPYAQPPVAQPPAAPGYGDPPGFGVAPQPAAGYGGQGDGQAGGYAAQPGGGYQRPSVSSAQGYHPYRR
ncbi:DAZ-associated protein 1 isoform X2 [Magallana gigas]|uniref:RRM domain-containing protein n=2 Tax=Magallana gigas TaxID=29159 RepID=A0A8W8IC02_MAGGI|nr:DAZ-associated protein 1 isoform X2 [Crassostrea gigas]|eukprot:XP_011424947.1 PREDICTED: DAZ-associated protein 1 isoform X2 [Crassostrea gigas]